MRRGLGPLAPIPIPKSNEYNTIIDLLDSAEKWKNKGETDLLKKMWLIIAEKASEFANGIEDENNLPTKRTEAIIERCMQVPTEKIIPERIR